MKILTSIVFLSIFLSGYDQNEALSIPKDTKNVTLKLRLPLDVNLDPVGVMYRSDICTQQRSKGNSEKYTVPGFHYTELSSATINNAQTYELLIPYGGGGDCRWNLSNVKIRISFKKEAFGNRITDSLGNGVILVFDENPPQEDSGVYKQLNGNIEIKTIYFPWVDEDFSNTNSYEKTIRLYGEPLFPTYKLKETNSVLFTAITHSEIVVNSQSPKVKQEGNHFRFVYPDGTIVSDGSVFPDYEKLLSLIDDKRK